MIDHQPIATCGNSVHLFIKFLLLCHASLNNLAVQLFAWVKVFASATCDPMRDAFTLQFLLAARCSLVLVASFIEVRPVYLLVQSLHWSL